MQTLTLEELANRAAAFDQAILLQPEIDHFCSRSAWIIPAHETLMPEREPWVHESEDGFVALARGTHPAGWRYAEALEAMWRFACPFAGADPESLARAFAALCRSQRDTWDVLLLSGIAEGSPLFHALLRAFGRHFRLRRGPLTQRICADLDGGLDAYLSRRSANLRKTLRRADAAARRAGICFVDANSDAPPACSALYRRILDVEARSWKGRQEVGITQDGMRQFYDQMLPRLASQSALHVLFAQHAGRDVGFIFGGTCGASYRGLQCSYDADYRRFSLGSLTQLEQIKRLCSAGFQTYDLGSDVPYKRRWGSVGLATITMIISA